MGRALRAMVKTLPPSALLVAVLSAPYFLVVAALIYARPGDDAELKLSSLCAFSGLGYYGLAAGTVGYAQLTSHPAPEPWLIWLSFGLLALLLQHTSVGMITHRHYAREGWRGAVAAGTASIPAIFWLTLSGALAVGLVHACLIALVVALGLPEGTLVWPIGAAVMTMAASRVWLVLPVIVVERKGLLAALRRSAELTRSVRWRVWLLFLGFVLLPIAALFTYDNFKDQPPTMP